MCAFQGADVSENRLQVRIFVQLYIYAGPPHTRGHIIVTSAGGVTRSRPAYVDDYKVFISLYIRVLYGMCVAYPSLCSAYDFRPPLFFQMSLTHKFKDAVSGGAVNSTSLCIGTRCPVIHCHRIGTKYGDAVHLTLREEIDDNMVRVFLPRQYGSAISEADMTAINSRQIQYYLKY